MRKNVVNSILLGILVITTCFGGYVQSNWTTSGSSKQLSIVSPEINDDSNQAPQSNILIPQSAATTKDWTFMVYLDADNNLESAGISDINEMEIIGSTGAVNVVVQIDRIGGYDTSNGDWTGTRRYYITSDTSATTISSSGTTLTEKNMGDGAVLSDFITWTQTNYPANNYALILWDHGSGIMASSYQGGVCWDDSSNSDYLTVAEIQTAISGKNIALLGFDACLMASAEWFYALNGYATTLVGSEKTEPGAGWPYHTILQWLVANPTATSATLGQQIVLKYMASYSSAYTVTQSAVDSSKMAAVLSSASSFAQVLINNIGSFKSTISTIRDVVQEYDSQPYIDLYDFAYRVKANIPSVSTQADAVMSAISTAVIQNGYSAGASGSHGLTVYFPKEQNEFSNIYRNNVWSTASVWDEFILQYYGASTTDDQFEDNDVKAQAARVYSKVYPSLVWSDDDWYNFTVTNGKVISVTLTFTHSAGVADLDLYLYNSASTLLGSSAGTTNTETISWTVSGGDQTLYLWVDNKESGISITYTLTVNIPIDDDVFEENDNRATAHNTGATNFTLPNLVAIDPDWFKFTAPDDCLITVNLTFIAAQGMLELQLWSSENAGVTWKSINNISSAADNAFYQFGSWYASLSLTIAIGVINYENNSHYDLTVTTDPGADDSYEENDYLNDLSEVSAGIFTNLVGIDNDLYNVTLIAGSWLNILLEFRDSEGDLDLYLFNQTSIQVAESAYWVDNERIVYQVPSNGTYSILVRPYEINLHYNLTIDTNSTFWNDVYDGSNDDWWQIGAFPQLTVGQYYDNLSAWDEDFYAIQLTDGDEFGFAVIYDESVSTLAVLLYDNDQNLLTYGFSEASNEYMFWVAEYTGVHYIRILPFQRIGTYALYPYLNHDLSYIGSPISVTLSGSLTVQCTENVNSIDGVESYIWDFGDGQTQYGGNISHVYTAPGTYYVYLTINEYGEIWETSTIQIRVWAVPITFDLILHGGNPVNGTSVIINWTLNPLNVQSLAIYFEYDNFTGTTGLEPIWTSTTDTSRNSAEIMDVTNGTYYVAVVYSNPLGTAMSNVLQVIVGSGEFSNSGIAGYDMFLLMIGLSSCLYLLYRKQRGSIGITN